MFTPKEFEFNDRNELIAFMKRYSFAILVTSDNGMPVATHLPFHILERHGKIFLTAHMAKANKQHHEIENKTVMVIFSQPHAYISTSHYEKEQSVPTWNYIAVHAYGTCTVVRDIAQGMTILEQMIDQSEPAYRQQWDGLPEAYKTNMFKGIIPFEIEVTDIKSAAKLSQNKTENERQKIVSTLDRSADSAEKDIAYFMKKATRTEPLH